ncbi:sodium-dependent transporter [Lachnospiraceae bacterium]|nr:sodium-dependent transporter [Lachnospiraceae bacterium]
MEDKKRDGFSSQVGFIMACVGSAVGMGNIWRFPIMVSMWGGMTFLIPYFLCVILISQSGVIGEMAFGRSAGAGPMGAFGMATKKRFGNQRLGEMVGFIPTVGSLLLAIGYSCVVGWIFKYFFLSLSGGIFQMGQDMDVIGGMFGRTASAWGNNLWIVIALLCSFAIMAFGIASGIEQANKVMMPLLFFLFIALSVYIALLPGASAGYRYIFTIHPEGLSDPLLWIFAFGQAFFSLSIAGNGTVIYGSYLKKDEDVVASARSVAVFDTLAALLAAFVIIPAMAAGGAELSSGGPGLMFIFLINVFNGMPGGRIVGIIFYTCVLFAGVSSIINLYEAPVATLQERLHMKRLPATAVIGVIGCAVAVCIQGIVSDWMDFVSNYMCPLGAFLAGVMFFWLCGKQFVLEQVEMGAARPIGSWVYPVGKYVYCTLCIVALVAGIVLGGIG